MQKDCFAPPVEFEAAVCVTQILGRTTYNVIDEILVAKPLDPTLSTPR